MILQGKIEFNSLYFDIKPKLELRRHLENFLNNRVHKTYYVDFREGIAIKYDKMEIDALEDGFYFKMFVTNPHEVLKDKVLLKLVNKEVQFLHMFRLANTSDIEEKEVCMELYFCFFNLTSII
jgi:hypothetical protein